jgi:alkylhydroperoxidase family enzyme
VSGYTSLTDIRFPPMPTDDPKRSLHRLLVDRILQGPGRAPADQRAGAFDNATVPEALRRLLEKVATRSAQVTDADFAAAKEAGFTDDQLFELVICAAVGHSTRQYEAGLAALAEATADRETG